VAEGKASQKSYLLRVVRIPRGLDQDETQREFDLRSPQKALISPNLGHLLRFCLKVILRNITYLHRAMESSRKP